MISVGLWKYHWFGKNILPTDSRKYNQIKDTKWNLKTHPPVKTKMQSELIN